MVTASALYRRSCLKSMIIILLAIVILTVAVTEPVRAVALVDDAAIAITLLILGACGITFAYATKQAAAEGVTNLINGFLDAFTDISIEDLIPVSMQSKFIATGVVVIAAVKIWNTFINWVKAKVAFDGSMDIEIEVDYTTGEIFSATSESYMSVDELLSHLPASFSPLVTYVKNNVVQYKDATWVHAWHQNNGYYYISLYLGQYAYYQLSEGRYSLVTGNNPDGTYYSRAFYGAYWNGGNTYSLNTSSSIAFPNTYSDFYVSNLVAGAIPIPIDVPGDIAGVPEIVEGEEDQVYVPTIPGIWSGNPDEYAERVIEGVGTGTLTVPAVEVAAAEVDIPGTETDIPGVGEGDTNINWERFLDIELFHKFPFSLPVDVYAFFDAIAAPPKEPVFEVRIFPESVENKYGFRAGVITLDFREFDTVRSIVRTGFLLLFIAGLIGMTKKYIWGGGT